jgi:phosphinothricin acetyltransferase
VDVTIRTGTEDDLPELVRIYNHYIETSPATFDLVPHEVDERRQWFAEHSGGGRYRMLVAARSSGSAEDAGVLGYACSGRFRNKAAYDPSVEASVYVDADAVGQGIGAALYGELLGGLRADPGVHRVYAGITLPNDGSVSLHERFGFERVGTFREVGLKFDRYWDVGWYELRCEGAGA